jgi:hypothetical protein
MNADADDICGGDHVHIKPGEHLAHDPRIAPAPPGRQM